MLTVVQQVGDSGRREPRRAGSQRPVAALHHLASLFDARHVPILISHL